LRCEKVNFDQYVPDYNQLLADRTCFFASSESYFAWYKVNVARRLVVGQPQLVHEFGCGIGRNLAFLARAFPGAAFFASDISEASVEKARSDNPQVKVWVEGRDTAPTASFDLVFVAGVYHHITPSERASVSETLFERVRPGGDVIIFEQNPFNPVTRRIVDSCPYDADAVLLSPGELRRHLAKAGFDVAKVGYALFVPRRLRLLTKLDRFLEWLPLGGQYWVMARRPLHG
jgi:SAM-dependent methyltransferase